MRRDDRSDELTPRPERELRELLDALYSGSIADRDELSPHEERLLREHLGEGEELEALIDRLRGPKPDGD